MGSVFSYLLSANIPRKGADFPFGGCNSRNCYTMKLQKNALLLSHSYNKGKGGSVYVFSQRRDFQVSPTPGFWPFPLLTMPSCQPPAQSKDRGGTIHVFFQANKNDE